MEYYSDIRDEGNPVICFNMNESEGYYTNWNNSKTSNLWSYLNMEPKNWTHKK